MATLNPRATRPPLVLFLGVAAAVYALSLAIGTRLPKLDDARAVAIGMTLDLFVVVPAAFYVLVVRRRRWPLVTVAPVALVGLLAAARILPDEQETPLRVVEALAVPLELGVLSWIAWRATRAVREAREVAGDADPLERFRRAACAFARNERAAALLASEIAVLYYAFAAWRARPHAPAGTTAIAHHRRAGHREFVIVLLLVFAAEGIATHVLVAKWSPLAALLLTIGTAYGALWIVADCRATILRPILVDGESVTFRAGFRCTLRVPRSLIQHVGREKPALGKECLNLSFLGAPTSWITLAGTVTAEGPYGFRRRVRAIGVAPDVADDEFERILSPPAS